MHSPYNVSNIFGSNFSVLHVLTSLTKTELKKLCFVYIVLFPYCLCNVFLSVYKLSTFQASKLENFIKMIK